MVTATIDGTEITVEDGTTVLEAARSIGAVVPTLCYLEGINDVGACRICVVEERGTARLIPACNTALHDGMEIETDNPRIRRTRKTNLELILSKHRTSCTTCVRNGNCLLQSLAKDLGIISTPFSLQPHNAPWPQDAPLIRDSGKCVQCMRCVSVCSTVQGVNVWQLVGSGSHATVNLLGTNDIRTTKCTYCGQCAIHCPTGALHERDDTDKVLKALADPDTVVVAQMAPAVRVAWAERLGIPREQATAELLAAALKKIGVDYVFDTTFSADLTVIEEASELIERLQSGAEFDYPMFTSCCAGWFRFVKTYYPTLIPHLSSVKSPQQMFGSMMKGYFAEKLGVDPERICCVSLMPCISKKFEAYIEKLCNSDRPADVDIVLTTRELDRLLGICSVDAASLEPQPFDSPLGTSSGAGVIFGITGGVMEAALRSAYYLTNGANPDPNIFRYNLRQKGMWKEGVFELGDRTVRVAVAHGLKSVRELLDAILGKRVSYDFVEIMACPDGCIGGGGQPIIEGVDPIDERKASLSGLDVASPMRFAHENPVIKECYENCLGLPLSARALHLLHIGGSDENL